MKIILVLGLLISSTAAAAIGYRLSGGDLEALIPPEVAEIAFGTEGTEVAAVTGTTDTVASEPAEPNAVSVFLRSFLNAPSDGSSTGVSSRKRRSDISAMPPAYDRWQRTDYLNGNTIHLAWKAIDKRVGKPSNKPIVSDGAELDGDGTAVLYTAGRESLLIVADRSPQTHTMAEGVEPKSVTLAGYTLTDISGDQKKVVDLAIDVHDNFSIRLRGRTSLATVEEFLKQLDIPGMGGPNPSPEA